MRASSRTFVAFTEAATRDHVSRARVAGDAVVFDAVWRVMSRPVEPLLVFSHLLDASGGWVAGHDLLNAAYVGWTPGDVIVQRHVLHVPADVAPGAYTVSLGLYFADGGRRIVTDRGADSTTVGVIEVSR